MSSLLDKKRIQFVDQSVHQSLRRLVGSTHGDEEMSLRYSIYLDHAQDWGIRMSECRNRPKLAFPRHHLFPFLK